jgi:hypothetical protein
MVSLLAGDEWIGTLLQAIIPTSGQTAKRPCSTAKHAKYAKDKTIYFHFRVFRVFRGLIKQ